MILSGNDLKLYIRMEKLKIEPLFEGNLQQNGIDLMLEQLKVMKHPFYLGCTLEKLELPDDLMAFVQLRSTWARRGYLLPPTIVDAGFRGNITLEIVSYLDRWPDSPSFIDGPLGKPFAHLIFAKTSGPCDAYRGKYTDQTGITEAR